MEFDTKILNAWRNMHERVAGQQETYASSSIAKDWNEFEPFYKWAFGRVLSSDLELDKDLRVLGNKHYSPATCVWVPKFINMIPVHPRIEKQVFPIGVFQAPAGNFGALFHSERLGFYEHPFLAHRAWQLAFVKECNRGIEWCSLQRQDIPDYKQVVASLKKLQQKVKADHKACNRTYSLL
jgi:hypothetical protein